MLNINAQNQDLLNQCLTKTLNEYLMLSQMYSFEGSEQDFQKLATFAGTCLDQYINILISNQPSDWSWDAFLKARSEWQEKPSPQSKEKLIEYVKFNLGEHKSALHTGERWSLEEDRRGILKFSASFDPFIKLSQLEDLRKGFPFIEDVTLNKEGLFIKYSEGDI